MKLKSFGCSFVYGSDLSDCPHGVNENNPPPSRLSWPALLADEFGLEYQCLAKPGASNLQILESVLCEIDSEEDLYVINWTWIERFGYFDENVRIKNNNHPWNPYGWASVLPADETPAAKNYYKYLHSQMRDKLDTLIHIKSAIDNLTQSGKKFVMTYTDDLIWETQWHTTPAILYLQDKIRTHLHGFDDMGFIPWADRLGFEISGKMHPLEDAHRAAADLMSPKIKHILSH